VSKYPRNSRILSPLLATHVSILALAAALASGAAKAADVTQIKTDDPGHSSLTESGNWSASGVPTSGNVYFNNGSATANLNIRAPTSPNPTSITFAGDALHLGATGSNFGQLVLTTSGATVAFKSLVFDGGRVTVDSAVSGEFILGSAGGPTDGITLNGSTPTTFGDGSLAGGNILTVSANIFGAGGIAVSAGAGGIVQLEGASSYTGATIVGSGAVLRQGAANALTTGAGANSVTTVNGSLQLSGNHGFVAALGGLSTGIVENGQASDVVLTIGRNDPATIAFAGNIRNGGTGTVAVVKTGAGRQTLSGNNEYTGGTTINEGALRLNGVNGSGTAGTGGISISSASGTLEATNAVTVANAISLSGRGNDTTAHLLNVGAANTISGGISLLDGASADPDNYNVFSNSGTLNVTGAISSLLTSGTRSLNLGGAGSGNIAGGIAMDAGAVNVLNKSGAGTWTLSSAVQGLDAANVTAGTLALANPTFAVAGNLMIGASGTVQQSGGGNRLSGVTGDTVANGKLSLNGFDAAVNGLTGSGIVENGASGVATLLLGKTGIGDKTFSGAVQNGAAGTLALIKTGDNLQILSGTKTYTGATMIADGQLRFSGGTAGTSGIAVYGDTSTLQLSSGASVGAVSLNGRDSASTVKHIVNVSGSNTISGVVTLGESTGSVTPDHYTVTSDTGSTLNLTGGISSTLGGARALDLSGEGNGNVDTGVVSFNAAAVNTLNKAGSGTWTVNSSVTGLDALNADAGVLALGSDIAVAGDIHVGGILQLKSTDASAQGLTGAGTLADVATSGNGSLLTLGADGVGDKTFDGTITDATDQLRLVKTGNNRQIFTHANSYEGGTTINDGKIQLSGSGTLGSGKVTVAGSGSGDLELSNLAAPYAADLDLVGRTSDTSHVDNVAGDNSLTGVISLKNSTTPGNSPDNYNFQVTDGTLAVGAVTADGTSADTINLNLVAATGKSGTIGAINLAGSGASRSINKSGDGTWSLGGATSNVTDINVDDGTLVLDSAAVAYTGTATIDAGATLKQGVSGALDGKKIQVNGALDLNGEDASLPGLNGASTGSVTNSNTAAALLTITQSGEFAGDINDDAGQVALTMDAVGETQVLSGAGDYSGATIVANGVLEIRNGGALGLATQGTKVEQGGQLYLNGTGTGGDVNSTENLTLVGSNAGTARLRSDGDNSISGAISLTKGPGSSDETVLIASNSGTLTFGATPGGSIAADGTSTVSNLGFVGAGNVTVVGALNLAAATGGSSVVNHGSGIVTLNGAVTMAAGATVALIENAGTGSTVIDSTLSNVKDVAATTGTVAIGASADVSTVDRFDVEAGAFLDATDVVGGFDLVSSQTLYGSGTVIGLTGSNGTSALAGSVIDVGEDDTFDLKALTFNGDLSLLGGSFLEIDLDPFSLGAADMLIVAGDLAIHPSAIVQFTFTQPLDDDAYVFAHYGSMAPQSACFQSAIPAGYHIECNYNNGNDIALVKGVPIPAPLALIGLGALAMGGARRYLKR
jgi:fibronectin-binding autotransporter adhesin